MKNGQIGELVASITKENHTNPTSQIRFHDRAILQQYIIDKTKKFDMTAARGLWQYQHSCEI